MERTSVGVAAAQQSGRQMFCGIELLAAPGALVPRAETELLARTALSLLPSSRGRDLRVVDMCCGSGNLARFVAHEVRSAQVWAADLTTPCVELARRNAAHVGVKDRVHVLQGDLWEAIHDLELEGTVDLVMCNPPYISTGKLEGDSAALLELEPREAFDGGPYGLSIHQRVIAGAPRFVKTGGWLCFEFGLGQERQLEKLFERAKVWEEFRTVADPGGAPRVAAARLRLLP